MILSLQNLTIALRCKKKNLAGTEEDIAGNA
jgi:hypothetical protein